MKPTDFLQVRMESVFLRIPSSKQLDSDFGGHTLNVQALNKQKNVCGISFGRSWRVLFTWFQHVLVFGSIGTAVPDFGFYPP